MIIHQREENVRRARATLTDALLKAIRDEGLTTGETIKVVTSVMSDHLLSIAQYAIRYERHGDTDKPGGLVDEDYDD